MKNTDSTILEILNLTPLPCIIVNNQSIITYANECAQNLFLTDSTQLPGLRLSQFLSSLNQPDLNQFFSLALQNLDVQSRFSCEVVNKIGLHLACNVVVSGIVVESSKMGLIQFEQKLNPMLSPNSEALSIQILKILDMCPLPIVTTNKLGQIVTWNPSCEKLLGWSRDEVIGSRAPSVPATYFNEALRLYEIVKAGGTVADFRTQRLRKDGSLVDLALWLFPIPDTSGDFTNICGVMIDIANQVKSEQLLKLAKDQAETANTSKSRFIATMSHEIRTPLATILSAMDLMTYDPQVDLDKIRMVQRHGDHLLGLIDNVLDLTKIEAQQLHLNYSYFSPKEQIEDALSIMKPKIDARGLQLITEIASDITPAIYSDSTRLRQVIINLVNNAVKFTTRGFIRLKASMIFAKGKNMLSVVVEDSGVGISVEHQTSIFEMFTQLENSATSRSNGAGIGLNLSRKIAHALGGELSLERTEIGKGSTFCLLLPSSSDSAVAKSQNRPRSFYGSSTEIFAAKPLNGFNLLLVDDSEDLRRLTALQLSRAGATVSQVSNGFDAIDSAQLNSYDAVLMDLEMPDISGLQTVAKLREGGMKQPIFAFTAHALKEELERCLMQGCNGYFSKPINLSDIVQKILELKP